MSETISNPDTEITIPSAAEMVKKYDLRMKQTRLSLEMAVKKDELSYERSCSKFKQKFASVSFANFTSCVDNINSNMYKVGNVKCSWMLTSESDKLKAVGYDIEYYDYNMETCRDLPGKYDNQHNYVGNTTVYVTLPRQKTPKETTSEPTSFMQKLQFWK